MAIFFFPSLCLSTSHAFNTRALMFRQPTESSVRKPRVSPQERVDCNYCGVYLSSNRGSAFVRFSLESYLELTKALYITTKTQYKFIAHALIITLARLSSAYFDIFHVQRHILLMLHFIFLRNIWNRSLPQLISWLKMCFHLFCQALQPLIH